MITRSSWLPSAMPSSSAGWRRMIASTSVIFNGAPPRRPALIVNYNAIVYNRAPACRLARPLLDRPRRAREAVRPARGAALDQHERLVAPLRPDRLDQGRRRADALVVRRRPRRRARGPGRGAAPRARDRAGRRAGPADRRPVRLARRLARLHAALAVGREPQPLVPGLARRPARRAARRLLHALPDPARGHRRRHAQRRPQRPLPAVVGDALGRRRRAAPEDGRGDARVEHRLSTSSTSTSPAPACSSARPSGRASSSSRPSSAAAAT